MKLTKKQEKLFDEYFKYINECREDNTINDIDIESLLTRLYNDLHE